MKRALVLMSLILVVMLSGCSNNRDVQVVEDNGLVVNEFYVEPLQAEAHDEIVVHAEIENKGWTTAKEVEAVLYGTGLSDDVLPSVKQFIGVMRAPDLYTDPPIPGDFVVKEWILTAKEFPEGNKYPFPLYMRVFYDYSTTGSAVITAYNEDEFKRKTIQQDLEAPIIVSNSQGTPIKVSVTGESPVKVDLDTETDTTTYRIIITNAGDGIPITDDENGKINGKIELIGEAEFSGSCMGESASGKEVEFDVKLNKDQETKRSCTIKFEKDTWETVPTSPIQLMFELDYKYYLEEQETVTVIGETV